MRLIIFEMNRFVMNEKSIARLTPAGNVSLLMILIVLFLASGLCAYVKRSLPYTFRRLASNSFFLFERVGGPLLSY